MGSWGRLCELAIVRDNLQSQSQGAESLRRIVSKISWPVAGLVKRSQQRAPIDMRNFELRVIGIQTGCAVVRPAVIRYQRAQQGPSRGI